MAEDPTSDRYVPNIPIREASLPEPPLPPDRCPRCHMPMEPGSTFCKACGSRLRPDPPSTEPIPAASWTPTSCPRCGRPMEEGYLGALTPFGKLALLPLAYLRSRDSADDGVPDGGDEIEQPPSVAWRLRWSSLAKWQRCTACHLLHYPGPPGADREATAYP